jgi:O-antigen/teichoic acid export membrane protein
VFENSALSFASRMFMALSRTVVVLVVIALLGPAEQGMLSVAMAVAIVAAMIVGAGLEVANAYFAATRTDQTRAVIGNSVAVAVLGGAAMGSVLWLAYPLLPFFAVTDAVYRPLLGIAIVPATGFVLLSGVGVGLNRYRLLLGANLVVYGVYLAVGLAASIAGIGAWAVFAGWIASNVLGCVVLTSKMLGRTGPPLGVSLLREQVAYGSRAYITNLLSWLTFRVDLLMVSSLLGPLATGFYALAATIAEGLLYVSKTVSQPLMTHALTEERAWTPIVERAYRAVLVATLALALVVIVAGPPLILVTFGEELAPAIPALAVLALAQAPMALAMMAAAHLFGLGAPSRTIRAGAIAVAVTVAFDAVAIPTLGIIGAAAVSLVAYTLAAAMQLQQVMLTLGSGPRWRSLIPQADDLSMLRQIGARLRRQVQG